MTQPSLFGDEELPSNGQLPVKRRSKSTGEQRRDAGMAIVADNTGDWWEWACEIVSELQGWSGTGEDLRDCVTFKIGKPHSPNAWGALVSRAVKTGWIVRTGERRKMKSARSHARSTDVYRSA